MADNTQNLQQPNKVTVVIEKPLTGGELFQELESGVNRWQEAMASDNWTVAEAEERGYRDLIAKNPGFVSEMEGRYQRAVQYQNSEFASRLQRVRPLTVKASLEATTGKFADSSKNDTSYAYYMAQGLSKEESLGIAGIAARSRGADRDKLAPTELAQLATWRSAQELATGGATRNPVTGATVPQTSAGVYFRRLNSTLTDLGNSGLPALAPEEQAETAKQLTELSDATGVSGSKFLGLARMMQKQTKIPDPGQGRTSEEVADHNRRYSMENARAVVGGLRAVGEQFLMAGLVREANQRPVGLDRARIQSLMDKATEIAGTTGISFGMLDSADKITAAWDNVARAAVTANEYEKQLDATGSFRLMAPTEANAFRKVATAKAAEANGLVLNPEYKKVVEADEKRLLAKAGGALDILSSDADPGQELRYMGALEKEMGKPLTPEARDAAKKLPASLKAVRTQLEVVKSMPNGAQLLDPANKPYLDAIESALAFSAAPVSEEPSYAELSRLQGSLAAVKATASKDPVVASALDKLGKATEVVMSGKVGTGAANWGELREKLSASSPTTGPVDLTEKLAPLEKAVRNAFYDLMYGKTPAPLPGGVPVNLLQLDVSRVRPPRAFSGPAVSGAVEAGNDAIIREQTDKFIQGLVNAKRLDIRDGNLVYSGPEKPAKPGELSLALKELRNAGSVIRTALGSSPTDSQLIDAVDRLRQAADEHQKTLSEAGKQGISLDMASRAWAGTGSSGAAGVAVARAGAALLSLDQTGTSKEMQLVLARNQGRMDLQHLKGDQAVALQTMKQDFRTEQEQLKRVSRESLADRNNAYDFLLKTDKITAGGGMLSPEVSALRKTAFATLNPQGATK